MNNMNNVKVGYWIVNLSDDDKNLTIGKEYKVIEDGIFEGNFNVIDDIGHKNVICKGNYE